MARIQAARDQSSSEIQATIALLYRRCLPELQRCTASILGSDHDAEDAAHDAFEKALRELARFDVRQPATFRAWLRVIARCRCVDVIRRSGQVDFVPLEAAAGLETGNAEETRFNGASSTPSGVPVLTLLKELPRSQHQALALHCLGFETDEVASMLDRTPGAVRILRHRGLRTLRERLAAA
ncbi:MAG: RNA polymerase sigma factor [Solirubrobacterales bacterium]